ncbi:hypothetical protein SprV_0502029800 [Sparganum proliferum]
MLLCWSSDCERPFAQPKSLLSSDLLLTHYDPTLPITVATDASNHGADALSRLIVPDQEPEEDTVIAAIAIEDDVRRQLSGAIADPLLRQDITYVQTFWLTSTLSGDLHQFFLRRASLSVDSCLMLAG